MRRKEGEPHGLTLVVIDKKSLSFQDYFAINIILQKIIKLIDFNPLKRIQISGQ